MIIHDVAQRSPEWFALRCGRLTGTAAKDMLATIKSGEAAARRDLRMRLVCERLTGQTQDNGYINADMQRGIDKEPEALLAYESATGHLVQAVGFCAHPDLRVGCSPDGLIADGAGVLEVKCPKSATHLGYLRSGTLPSEHRAQIQHALWLTGAEWADFVSFDDRFPSALQFFRVRVERADVDLKAYELVVRMFLSEVDREFAEVEQLAGVAT